MNWFMLGYSILKLLLSEVHSENQKVLLDEISNRFMNTLWKWIVKCEDKKFLFSVPFRTTDEHHGYKFSQKYRR